MKLQTEYRNINFILEISKTPNYRPCGTVRQSKAIEIDLASGAVCFYQIVIRSQKNDYELVHEAQGQLLSSCHQEVLEEIEAIFEDQILSQILTHWKLLESKGPNPPWAN